MKLNCTNEMMGHSRQPDQTSVSSRPSQLHRRNIFHLLSRRELCPRGKHVPKRRWAKAYESSVNSSLGLESELFGDAKHNLASWVEAESLRYLSPKYCPLVPPPRSTIAAAFSPDGRTLASTHGDHTVKIIDCQTGSCMKVLSGHRRTPWVVRFHPLHPNIIASGSLDHEVRIWDAKSSDCIGSRDFYRPIASIAFHAEGELLAVASGHKLYIWQYNKKGEASPPTIVLRTRRSLRAVHFHPHAAPFLLTAEVNDLDSSDSSMTRATSHGYLRYPPPAVFVANVRSKDHLNLGSEVPVLSLPFLILPSYSVEPSQIDLQHANRHVVLNNVRVGSSTATQMQTDAIADENYPNMVSPMDTSPVIPAGSLHNLEDTINNNAMRADISDFVVDAMETTEIQFVRGSRQMSASRGNHGGAISVPPEVPLQIPLQISQVFPNRDTTGWQIPSFQGWIMGQNQIDIPSSLPHNGGNHEFAAHRSGSLTLASDLSTHNMETGGGNLTPGSNNTSGVSRRSDFQNHASHSHVPVFGLGEGATTIRMPPSYGADAQPVISRIQSELATSLAVTTAAELPCTVKLRVWTHDSTTPSDALTAERCRLTIPHAVLCSEMGAHFSPCGRFLAACVACMLPQVEADPGLQSMFHQDPGAATSPTRHPISAHKVMYELRIYSLEEASFGEVLVSRAIRAAHCLTSIQFSPTSEHILLAYGRRHGSLLKNIVMDGVTTSLIYTVLEVYSVSDMELVRGLTSSEDEVNVACFHPFAGGGLVYGTKEGKLRILQFDGNDINGTGSNYYHEENMSEVQTYALEC